MNSVDKHAIIQANHVIMNQDLLLNSLGSKQQPFNRTINNNMYLDKFLTKHITNIHWICRVDSITYIRTKQHIYPAIMFNIAVNNTKIISHHILGIYSKDLAKVNELWAGDWISFTGILKKTNISYAPYLYIITNIKDVNIMQVNQYKLIHCIQKDKKKKPYHYEVMIRSNRDKVPKDNIIRTGYAISKATPSIMTTNKNQLNFQKPVFNKDFINYIDKYSHWKQIH